MTNYRCVRAPTARFALDADEIVIDSFAGGGGASEGIDAVLAEIGRHVDIAINHDAEAIALHKANHPHTEHYTCDVFSVNIVRACCGRRVGLGWYSPDCTYHSKARGGKPFRDRNRARRIRGLAWVIIKHAKELKAAGTPMRVIAMENVQEFADWGPLDDEGKIIAVKRGLTFRRWCRQLQNLGYELDMWELKGCDYGAPTTRERLFIVARFDGKPIVKPEPTHGSGRTYPWRTAAECIDFSLHCPSIFDRKKPLAENTLRRIFEGIRRYVIGNADPFIVPIAHQGDARANSINEPLRTITADRRGDFAVVQPIVVGIDNKSNGAGDVWPADAPLRTVTTENRFAVATPLLVRTAHGERDRKGKKRGRGEHRADAPLPTQTASNEFALVSPTLIQVGYGERDGQAPRVPGLEKPLGTVVSGGRKHALVAAFLSKHNGVDKKMVVGQGLDEPMHTLVAKNNKSITAVTLLHNTTRNAPTTPDLPLKTVATGNHHAVVTSHLLKLKGTSKAGQRIDEPLHTIQAQGNHYAEVRAFLIKFYSHGGQWGAIDQPIGTITAKDRIGLVTIHGEQYQIVDIGLRMLTPRELYRAQGFREDYIIDVAYNPESFKKAILDGHDVSVSQAKADKKMLTKTAQVRMCGNSVCPPVAEAIVRAQFAEPALEVAA